MVLTFEFPD